MTVRVLVVRIPDWPVVAAGVAPTEPAAVVWANRLQAVSLAARARGVQPGQRRREAQGRCPDLEVLAPDPGRDARAFEAVLVALDGVTPLVEVTAPGCATFPTRGPSRYFGGDEALAAHVAALVRAALDPLGPPGEVPVGVGVADGPFAASLAARRGAARGEPLVVAPGASAAFLAPAATVTLGRPDLVDVLGRLGIRTLGAFADLPSGDVLARFGSDGLAAHRLAAGLDERLPDIADPPADLTVAAALDPPAERVDTAAFVAKTLADDLHERLEQRGLACTRVLVEAETEHGETRARLWRHEGALTAAGIADRVRWQLDGWLTGPVAHRPTAGITRLTLVPDEVVPAKGRQLGFWGGETASAERASRALARVQAMLGPDAVRVPEWRGGRSPAEQVTLVPVHMVDLTDPDGRPAADPSWVAAPWPGQVPDPAPALVHADPALVDVLDADGAVVGVSGRGLLSADPHRLVERSGASSEVVSWAGPWTADERWWDPGAHRRRARLQVVTAAGAAHLVVLEGRRWWLEATYD